MIEADLALGRETTLTAELEGLVGAHPLRERLRGQLMICLYRTGRQAEALEAYAQIHRTLVDELGIPPGPPLQELQRSILNQDPQLDRRDADNEGRAASAVDTPLVEVAPAPPESPKNVAVLVIERESATSSDPGAQRSADEHELEATQAVIERHGGSVESVLGTRTMAVFGVPLAHEDDALRGLRAAAELTTRSPEGGPRPLAARVGLAAGEILAGGPVPISAEEPVRIAAELLETASPGEILVSRVGQAASRWRRTLRTGRGPTPRLEAGRAGRRATAADPSPRCHDSRPRSRAGGAPPCARAGDR